MAVTSSSDSLQLSCPSVQPVLGNLRCSLHALGHLFYISIDLYSSIATFSVTPLLLLWPLLQSYICGTDWSSSGSILCQGHTIAVPSVYLVLTKVLCCGKKKVSALVVCAVFLLMTLMVIQLAFFHCTFLGAAPFNIVSAVAMLTFVVFATVHILAVLFALPSLCRQPVAIWMISRGEKCHAIIQTVSLVILIIALFCLSRVVATSIRLTNVEHPDT